MDKLNRLKGALKGSITKLETFLSENNAENVASSVLGVKLKKVENLQKKLDELREQYYELPNTTGSLDVDKDLDDAEERLEQLEVNGRTIGGKVQSTAGGVGRNVADCMARLGADPLFLSLVGAQEYAKSLLSKMDHMDKRGIKVIKDARTATCVVVLDKKGECAFIVGDMSIQNQLLPELVEIHEDSIATASVVTVDGNMPVLTMNYIMNLCSKHKVPVWFEPTDISLASKAFESTAWRTSLAYASPNLNELRIMHNAIFDKDLPPLEDDRLERKIEESLHLGVPLLSDTFHTLVVTLASHGILLITKLSEDHPFPTSQISPNLGKIRAIHYPASVPESIISVSGAGDCFAAAMITGIVKGLHPDACINAGQRAAIVSLASHHAVPDTMSPDIVFPTSSTSSLMEKHPISFAT